MLLYIILVFISIIILILLSPNSRGFFYYMYECALRYLDTEE